MIALFIVFAAITKSLAVPADLVSSSFTKRGPADFVLEANSPLSRRSSLNYSQDYTTGGTINYTNSSTGFDVTWNTPDDFVVGVGWNPGSTA
jgi:endo-1,4-beta-xylanase